MTSAGRSGPDSHVPEHAATAGVGPLEVSAVGEFELTWGESLRWDDRRQRLYFVDCAAQTLHWLDNAEPPLHTMQMATCPTGLALTHGNELVVCLDEGLALVDPDAGTTDLRVPYPKGMRGRANDANADPAGTSSPAHSTWRRHQAPTGGTPSVTAGACWTPTSATPTDPPSSTSLARPP